MAVETNTVEDGRTTDASYVGALSSKTGTVANSQGCACRYFVGDMNKDSDRIMVEHITSSSLFTYAMPTKIGDIYVLREETTFTKEGNYLVALKYIEKVK